MTKLYLDELDAALGGSTFSTLKQDATDSKNVKEAIAAFCEKSDGKLSGEQWDKVRGKLAQYQSALDVRVGLANSLAEAIEKALKMLKDYMGSDQMLDTSKLEEYKAERQKCVESIASLRAMLTEKVEKKVQNADGSYSTTYVNAYDTATVQAQISVAEDTLKELDRIIEKIEGLDKVYKEAEAIMDEAYQDVVVFSGSVSSITPSGKYVYKKANG